jgi:hypothetical protein
MASVFFISCQKDDLYDPYGGGIESRDATSFSYSANPVNVGDSVTVTFDAGNGADCGHIQIQMDGPGDNGWVQVANHVTPDSGLATFVFEPDAPGEYSLPALQHRLGSLR